MGTRENQKRRKQHFACYLPLRTRNNPNNSSGSSGNRSDAFAVMHMDISAMMDNEALCDAHRPSSGAKRVNRMLAQTTSH